MLLDEVLPELSNEEEATSLLAVGEEPKDDLDNGPGRGTSRELKGIFGNGAPLPAMIKLGSESDNLDHK